MSAILKKVAPSKISVDAACKKIGDQFPQCPEGKLMFAVVEKAIRDLRDESSVNRASAKKYLRDDLIHAEICGIDPEWIRRIVKKMGICTWI